MQRCNRIATLFTGLTVCACAPNATPRATSSTDHKSDQQNGVAARTERVLIDSEMPPPVRLGFGDKHQWLAFQTNDPRSVTNLLRLANVREVSWDAGVNAASGGDTKVFVTAAVDGWVLAIDSSYSAFGETGELHSQELAAWSTALNTTVAHFFSDRRSRTFGWMLARQGVIARAYFEVENRIVTNSGTKSAVETAAEKSATAIDNVDLVFDLAREWSLDPRALEWRKDIPEKGFVGDSPE